MVRLFATTKVDPATGEEKETYFRCYPSVLDVCKLVCNGGEVSRDWHLLIIHSNKEGDADLASVWKRTLEVWGYHDTEIKVMERMPEYLL